MRAKNTKIVVGLVAVVVLASGYMLTQQLPSSQSSVITGAVTPGSGTSSPAGMTSTPSAGGTTSQPTTTIDPNATYTITTAIGTNDKDPDGNKWTGVGNVTGMVGQTKIDCKQPAGSLASKGTCSGTAKAGPMVSLTAKPSVDFALQYWDAPSNTDLSCPCKAKTDLTCSFAPASDASCTAWFKSTAYGTVSVRSIKRGAMGGVKADFGNGKEIDCTTTSCTKTVKLMTTVKFTAVPIAGKVFDGWYKDRNPCPGKQMDNPLSFSVDASNPSCIATFK